jgi:hypothetical protein
MRRSSDKSMGDKELVTAIVALIINKPIVEDSDHAVERDLDCLDAIVALLEQEGRMDAEKQ